MHNTFAFLGTVDGPFIIRTSQAGKEYGQLVVVVKRRYKKDDEWIESEDTLAVMAFGNRAGWLAKNISEGDRVFLSGRLGGETREHGGRTYYDTKLWADTIQPLGPPPGAKFEGGGKPEYATGGDRGGQYEKRIDANTVLRTGKPVAAEVEDEIPF